MALTADVKEELARVEVSKTSVRAAELASVLRFAGGLHIISGRIAIEAELETLKRENRQVYRAVVKYLEALDDYNRARGVTTEP